MGCTIVIDGFYGSCGKGKVAYHEAKQHEHCHFVRTGGPNSGHYVDFAGKSLAFRQLGAGAVLPNTTNYMAAGSVVDEERFLWEVGEAGVPRERLILDPRIILKKQEDSDAEQSRVASMGTTASGNGEAALRRMRREAGNLFVGDSSRIREVARVERVAPQLHKALGQGEAVVVEGVQGFGLSLFHSDVYPFCTSRDTTAAAFASEVGLAPVDITKAVIVFRTFPIRVGGNSGPMKDEIDWETVARESGAPKVMPELTSVTKRLRRVGRFDWDLARQAVDYNRARMTTIALMGVDRLEYSNGSASHADELSTKTRDFIRRLEDFTSCAVEWIGNGPATAQLIHRWVGLDGQSL